MKTCSVKYNVPVEGRNKSGSSMGPAYRTRTYEYITLSAYYSVTFCIEEGTTDGTNNTADNNH
jgi:hypothetical protein